MHTAAEVFLGRLRERSQHCARLLFSQSFSLKSNVWKAEGGGEWVMVLMKEFHRLLRRLSLQNAPHEALQVQTSTVSRHHLPSCPA